jgi:circadian clock protein KaiB
MEDENRFVLKLYVSGMSENSMLAIENVKGICDEYLNGVFDLDIIDIYKNPAVAEEQQIVFSPSLIKLLPEPKKIFIGNFSNKEKVIRGLGFQIKD